MEKVNAMTLAKGNSPAEMITMAVQGGANLDNLAKLLDIQERWEANEAKKAYHKAMAEFKANPPKIDKDKKVSFSTSTGKTSYNHASLANVVDKISTELSKHGLSASWATKQDGVIMVTCKITHLQGHSEETTLSAPSDTSGSKNAIQAIGSTITYLCRYSLLCLLGLATEDIDDDAQSVVEHITHDEVNILLDGCAELNIDLTKFCSYMKVEKVEDIVKSDYQKALIAIDNKRKKIKK